MYILYYILYIYETWIYEKNYVYKYKSKININLILNRGSSLVYHVFKSLSNFEGRNIFNEL